MFKFLKKFTAAYAAEQTRKARAKAVFKFYSDICALIDKRSSAGHSFAVYEFPTWSTPASYNNVRDDIDHLIRNLGFTCEFIRIENKIRIHVYW